MVAIEEGSDVMVPDPTIEYQATPRCGISKM
jgi:hypothetical protein